MGPVVVHIDGSQASAAELALVARGLHAGLQGVAAAVIVDTQALPPEGDEALVAHRVGSLDVEAMRLLNDLYEDRPVDAERMQRLISLFRLEFDDAAELNPVMTAGGKAKPVYLGLAMNAEQTLRLKPQNLLLNLPLAALM